MWEKMPQEGIKSEELKAFSNDETQFLLFFLEKVTIVPTVTIQHLQHIARLRLCLTMAAMLINDRLSGKKLLLYC